jgi:phospholipase/lecithinase/hemolysin
MKIAVFSLLVCVLLAGCSGERISQVVAFGDFNSDNGNGYQIVKQALALGQIDQAAMNWYETNHWEGRATNGPVAVEILAERLGVDLKDYATNGARSGYESNDNIENYAEPAFNTRGVLTQVDEYIEDLNGEKANGDALYFIQASFDDFFLGEEYTYDEKAIQERADQTVANLVTAVTKLAGLGARHFMVGKSADLTRVPLVRYLDLISEAKTFQDTMNPKLVTEMAALEQELDIDIELFDYSAALDSIWNNPEQYGFTNLVDQCLSTSENWDATICSSPDEHFWYDTFSFSRRAHQVIGEAMAEQLSK